MSELWHGCVVILLYFVICASTALIAHALIAIPSEVFRKILHMILLGSLSVWTAVFDRWWLAAVTAVAFALLVWPILALAEHIKGYSALLTERKQGAILSVLGRGHSERINTMVSGVILASTDSDRISMVPEIEEATMALRDYLYKNVYTHPVAKAEEQKTQDLLISLFQYFSDKPEQMSPLYFNNIERDGLGRCVCDFISGMTDRYAIELYRDLFVPKTWQGVGI